MIATRDAYGQVLAEIASERDDIVVMDADLAKSTKTADFRAVKPERFINVGIAEANLMGLASGISLTGKIPFASTFAVFATGRAFEIIRNSICYPKLNVKIVATHAGLTVGEDGGSHQAIEDIAIMRVLPNMTVIVPADGEETTQVIREVVDYVGPVYVRLGRSKVPNVTPPGSKFKIGKHQVLGEGFDITLVACGIMVSRGMEAREILSEEGISVEVINASTIKPFDSQTLIESVKKTKCVITAEEHSIIGGLGGAVSEILGEEFPVKIKRLGVRDVFGESGAPEEVMKKHHLTSGDIVLEIKKLLGRK